MSEKVFPDLQRICRLCLKENEGTVCIFPKEQSPSNKHSSLSIPMRIMTCSSLEVQNHDDFPKKICTDCRLQLEKSYYFRKMSQASDAKLKKHLRLVSMGKLSKVFNKQLDDDDEEDELEFKDSLDFIREQEEKQKHEERLEFEKKIEEIKMQYDKELKTAKETLGEKWKQELIPSIKEELKKELIPSIKEELKKELRTEVQNELEQNLRQELMDQCLSEAKVLARDEVREECRQIEMKSLLEDLQTYLANKKRNAEDVPVKTPDTETLNSNKKASQTVRITPKIEYVGLELEIQNQGGEEEINLNEEECDSEGNFLIYDIDEGFDVQKKESDHKEDADATEIEYEDEEITDNNEPYTKLNASEIIFNNEESQGATMTSYRIDNENGEIQFLKKNENFNNEMDEENLDQTCDENIMIIKLPEHMDTEEYTEEFEDQKYSKPKKLVVTKTEKSPEKNVKSIVSSTVSRTKTTVEATVLTKTYVNPMQRSTDTPKIFRCNDCPMVFSTKHSLDRHLRTHQKVEKTGVTFQCPECRIVVSCSSALRRHMYVHCAEKPFSCNLCEKSFVQKEILKRHMQTHTGVKPHQCPHCDRAFAQRINLTQHINRNHLEEPRIRQYPCHLCPKRFNHASGLSRHLTTHSGVVFQCSECDRTFGDRSSIKRHILNMHSKLKPQKVKSNENGLKL